MKKWTKEEVIEHFKGRRDEYIERAARVNASPLNFEFPYDGMEKVLLALWWLFAYMGRPREVVELGCGAGTFRKFFDTGLGLIYEGVDASVEAIEAAIQLWPAEEWRVFHVGDITREQLASHGRDLIFMHGVLMHLPPKDVAAVAAWTLKAGRAVMICEKQRWAKGEQEAPHVWVHDYRAIFGEPSYQAPMNATKDILIWRAKG